ncbi:GAP family protein [Solirubrobacter ginsenosidimutans]|uniref:GAP family protein n=1 Tax=Solirubrobacter ginsenosidimutans TaxID=490573 RepID=A0A9X3MWY0_9ACTN|nr:GAP family protein [Solirubrobacter ginsenosidimutans]MDA0164224.1 GAP family protein [Solirubrobacter ginsenosidimutans]
MTSLLAPVLLLGLADSLNPVTIAVAVLLATGERPARRLATYTFGTGVTYFLGGVVLTLGPAALLRTAVHHRGGTRTWIAEIVVGVLALGVAAFIVTRPAEAVSKRVPHELRPSRSFLLGVGITVVDLPTALMYFGAIALIVGAVLPIGEQLGLLVVFNVAYVAPLIAITVLTAVFGVRAQPALLRVRDFVARWGGVLLAALTAGSGVYLIFLGVRGLTR